jgi:D-psicose/D-tagatose/L-ribulose 3-epimerase
VVDADLSRTLRIWRNVWTDGMDLARSARRYIAEQMEAARASAAA